MRTAADLLEDASSRLGSTSEARWIIEAATGWDALRLRSRSDLRHSLPSDVVCEVERMVERRQEGEPLQYVLGTWAFRRLDVRVDPRVLVPRPETEQLVGFALEELHRVADEELSSGTGAHVVVADLGTGSGVIALSVALEASPPGIALDVWATDSSPEALEVARGNLDLLARRAPDAAARLQLSEGSWFEALPSRLEGGVGVVVSNPPYVSASEWEELDPVIRDHEPYRALVSGETGLEVLDLLVCEAPRWLAPNAALVLELAPAQADVMADRALAAGFAEVEVLPDLSGRARVLVARRAGVRRV